MRPQVDRPRAHPPAQAAATKRTIQEDLNVTGLLRLGDNCTFEGTVHADGGVVLGTNTIVKGDIITRGPVMLGAGSRVEGRVNPERRESEPLPERLLDIDEVGPREADRDVRLSTVTTTLDLLLQTAVKGASRGKTVDDATWWGLDREAAQDIASGVVELLDTCYRDGRNTPWEANEVMDIVVARALPLAIPMTVHREDRHVATVRINPPAGTNVGRDRWGPAVLSLISLIGTAVHPGFDVRPLDGIAAPGTASTDHVHARARVLAGPAAA